MNKSELAKLVNVTSMTICRWENDKLDNIKRSNISALAKVLDFNSAILFEYEQEKSEEEKDISSIVDSLMNDLNSNEALLYSGEPMDDITRELVRASIEQAARIAMARHKEQKENEKDL